MNVLIVEDDSRKSSILQKFMENKFNAQVHCVINEKEAKDELKNNNYNLVLLDMTLPNMICKGDTDAYGGMNVLSSMYYREIIVPVIVVTSYWDFKNLLARDAKELYFSRNKLFQTEIDYDTLTIVENYDYLDRLHQHMSYTYNNIYFGSIEFNYYNESWKKNLEIFLEELFNEHISV